MFDRRAARHARLRVSIAIGAALLAAGVLLVASSAGTMLSQRRVDERGAAHHVVPALDATHHDHLQVARAVTRTVRVHVPVLVGVLVALASAAALARRLPAALPGGVRLPSGRPGSVRSPRAPPICSC